MRLISVVCILAIAAAAVVPLTKENFDEVVNGEKNVFVKFYAPWCGHCQALAPEYTIFADSFANEPSLIVAEVDADSERELGDRFNIEGFPTLKFFPAGASDEPEDYDGDRTAEALVSWVNDRLGTHATVKKPVSEVQVLTPSNFDDLVKNSGKTVFVKFYAPWCGHCKHLAPTWEELGAVFAEEPSVVIAELDADMYRELAAEFDVHGYPTLKLFQGQASPVPYEGDRSLESLVEFVNEHAGTARMPDGSVDARFGRIPAVDEVIAGLKGAGEANLAKVKEAVEAWKGEMEESKKVYLSVVKKLREKGEGFLKSEEERIQRMLGSGSVSKVKKGAFRIRMNVLKAFEAMMGEKEEEKTEEEL